MTQGNNADRLEFAKQSLATSSSPPLAQRKSDAAQKSDILLNNFQIKKKRYRVLFNCDVIVWERLDSHNQRNNDDDSKSAQKTSKKESSSEREELSCGKQTVYGNASKIIHINEVIRVAKGNTKAATFRTTPSQYGEDLNGSHTDETTHSQHSLSSHAASSQSDQFLTIHYAERKIKSETDCNRWRVASLTLYNSDAYIIKQWHHSLNRALKETSPHRLRVQRLLVFINPYGGRGRGLRVYERYCKPLFQLAGIDASCLISQRANQIRDILMGHDLTPYDAVCCVGGDGTVAEVINGLIFRRMLDMGMDIRRPSYIPKPALPIGIIAAGSTDTIAYSVHGTSDPRTAAIHLILGQRRGLDISSVENKQGIIRFCASVCSYGYLGDVAAKSEQYRWMGPKRYEYTGVKAFLSNRGYPAELQILMPDEVDFANDGATTPHILEQHSLQTVVSNGTDSVRNSSIIGGSIADSKCYANCQRCSTALSMHGGDVPKDLSNATDDDIDNDELPTSSNLTLYGTHSIDDNAEYGDDDIDNIRIRETCDRELSMPKIEGDVILRAKQSDETNRVYKNAQSEKCSSTIINKEKLSSNNSTSSINNNNNYNNHKSNSIISQTDTIAKNVKTNGNWKTIKGKFFMINIANISCLCKHSPNGIATYSHLGDGYLNLVLVRKTTRINNVRFVMNTMGRTGDIRNLPFVEVYQARKIRFRVEPTATIEDISVRGSTQPIAESYHNTESEDDCISSWNCDGEVVTDLDISMSSHCQLVDVFMRGPHSYSEAIKIEDHATSFCCCTSRNNE